MSKKTCKIIPEAPNGKDSKLFLDALADTKNRNLAILAYGKAKTSEFKTWYESINKYDENGDPLYQHVKEYINLGKVNPRKDLGVPTELEFFINRLKERIEKVNVSIRNSRNKNTKKVLHDHLIVLEDKLGKLITTKDRDNILDIAKDELAYVKDLIYNKRELSETDINNMHKILSLYSKLGDHVLNESDRKLIEIEGTDGIIEKDYSEFNQNVSALESESRNLESELQEVMINKLLQVINTEQLIGRDVTKEELLQPFTKDINWASANTLDASRLNNLLLVLKDAVRKSALTRVTIEQIQLQKERIAVFNKLENSPLFKQLGYDLFKQEDSEGKWTGGLVNRYSHDYWSTNTELWRKYNVAKAEEKWSTVNKVLSQIRDISVIVDYFKDDKGKKVAASKLKNAGFSDRDIERMLTQAEEKYNKYRKERLEYIEYLEDLEMPPEARLRELAQWEFENSPQSGIDAFNGNKNNFKIRKANYSRFLTTKPKKLDSNGKATKWYDKKFDVIENDPILLESYEWMYETNKKLLAVYPDVYKQDKRIQQNFIFNIKKNVTEMFNEKGVSGALEGADSWIGDLIASGANMEFDYGAIDPDTGAPELSIPIFGLANNTIYNAKTGKRELDLSEKSTNLKRTYESFINAAVLYKHLANVEDRFLLFDRMFDTMVEVIEAPDGKNKLSKFDETIGLKKGLIHLKEANQYLTDVFYLKKVALEGVTKKKIRTKAEKEQLKVLEAERDTLEEQLLNTEDEKEIGIIQAKLEGIEDASSKLGKNLVWSKVGRSIIHWVQLKIMAFNIFSAGAELFFGLMSNTIHAQGNVDFTSKHVLKAYKLLLHSMGKNLTLDSKESETAHKISSLMDNFKVIGMASEIDKLKKSYGRKKLDKFAPYNIAEQADFITRGTTLIATMLATKVKDAKGNERSLWEAFDKNGEWKVDEFGDDIGWRQDPNNPEAMKKFILFKNKITQLNKRLHGNYDPDSSIKIKKTFLGAALSQFRTWIFEGAASRFEKEKDDEYLGRKVKGRWRTYQSFYKGQNLITGTLSLLGQLAKQATFRKNAFEGISEVDAENMRKNLAEIYWTIGLYTFGMLIRGLKDLDDDEDGILLYSMNFLINMGVRLQSDIHFYWNPNEIKNLNKSIVPMTGLLNDVSQWIDAAGQFIDGNDIIQRGPNAEMSRIFKETVQMLPYGHAYYRTYSSITQTF